MHSSGRLPPPQLEGLGELGPPRCNNVAGQFIDGLDLHPPAAGTERCQMFPPGPPGDGGPDREIFSKHY
jgi:hypothetical protein